MNAVDFNAEEYNWTDKSVIGIALLMYGGILDSFGNKIDGNIFYEVGKHKVTGKVAILPTEKNQEDDFINMILKKRGRLN